MSDEHRLFSPTVPRPTRPPWRLMSFALVGFFGGPLGVTVLMVLNARRLRAPTATVLAIAGVGALGAAGAVMAFAIRGSLDDARPIVVLSGGIVVALQILLLTSQERTAQLRSSERSSLWLPGIAAVILGAVALALVATLFVPA